MIRHWFCDVSKKRLSAENFQDHNFQETRFLLVDLIQKILLNSMFFYAFLKQNVRIQFRKT